MGQMVWVLDRHGYDARGGDASVFSTVELAKASVPWVTSWVWDPVMPWWFEQASGDADHWVIYEREIDDP